jgi:branched-chain amino acid transport system permease protein
MRGDNGWLRTFLPPGPSVLAPPRIGLAELIPWIVAVAVFFLFEQYLAFATSMLVMLLFALSLDIIVGYAGLISLGHAIFFGVGAYAAGLIALSGWTEPISGLLLASALSGLLGAALCVAGLWRLRGLLLIMTTLAIGLIALEIAKSLKWLTGGDDGLQGIEVAPLLGLFRWSVYGHTAYLYALAVVFVLFVVVRLALASPFGLALRGLRENFGRMQLVGAPVGRHLVGAFALSGAVAGAAGALSAQTTGFVDLNVLSLDISAGALVMLVLGGLGRLYGAFLGVPVFMLVQNIAAKANPFYWMFVVGGLLILVVLFSRQGLLGLLERAVRRTGGRRP